jgi:hypothetical protein
MKARITASAVALAGIIVLSCAGVPAKRVDSVVRGAVAVDLAAPLGEVAISAGPEHTDVERVVRELFPLAASHLPGHAGPAAAEKGNRAVYSVWIRGEEYARGFDTRTAVLCVLKLRSKTDGSVYATTIVADETTSSLESSAYLYTLLREALRALSGSVAASEKAMKAAGK